MKNLLSICIVAVILLGFNATAFSQAKFGHINTNELLQMMPGRAEATEELEKYARELETTFTSLQSEFQTKYQDFLENQETFSPLIKQSREKELTSLQERIVEFQESAQEDLVQRETQLLNPIIEQARKAIEDVARENGYTYVFDTSMGVLLYSEPSDDIMDKVKEKLGI
ncbi:MAG: OmpH family outer membrane protein [Bacteroidota bacterium]